MGPEANLERRACIVYDGFTRFYLTFEAASMSQADADHEAIDQAFFGILSRVITAIYSEPGRDRLSQALLFLLVRTANSWRSIRTLRLHSSDQQTYTVDAAILLRCIFDAYLQANLIYQDPAKREELAELYLDFAHVDRFNAKNKTLRHTNRLSRGLKAGPHRPEGELRLQREYDRVKARYYKKERWKDGTTKLGPGVRDKWYEGNLPKLAETAGKQAEYDTFITQFSGCVHSSAYSVEVGPLLNGEHISLLASGFTARVVRMNIQHNGLALSAEDLEIIDEMTKSLLDANT
jgi:hypothetical protein